MNLHLTKQDEKFCRALKIAVDDKPRTNAELAAQTRARWKPDASDAATYGQVVDDAVSSAMVPFDRFFEVDQERIGWERSYQLVAKIAAEATENYENAKVNTAGFCAQFDAQVETRKSTQRRYDALKVMWVLLVIWHCWTLYKISGQSL